MGSTPKPRTSDALIFPPEGHRLHTMFNPSVVRARVDGASSSERVTFIAARAEAKAFLKEHGAPGRHRVVSVLRANDDWELISFGPLGAYATLWNFTTGKPKSRVAA